MGARVREKPNGFAYLIGEGVSSWLHSPKAGPAYSMMLRLAGLRRVSDIPRQQRSIFNSEMTIQLSLLLRNVYFQAHRFAEDPQSTRPRSRDALAILISQDFSTHHFEFIW
jgi:hypothetical protein